MNGDVDAEAKDEAAGGGAGGPGGSSEGAFKDIDLAFTKDEHDIAKEV